LKLIKIYDKAIFISDNYSHNIKESLYNFTLDEYNATHIQNYRLNPESKLELSEIRPFGKWYEHYFGDIVIHNCTHWGIFSVNKDCILGHSKEYYENLIKQLCNSSNPEVGHYFERAWCAVFYPIFK